jgi:hypothetical protein
MDFLNSSATDLFFLDAEVSAEAASMSRMVEHSLDFVLAAYPRRQPVTRHLSLATRHSLLITIPDSWRFKAALRVHAGAAQCGRDGDGKSSA